MRDYAGQRGLKRLMIPVPLLTPKLSSLWLGLVTPLYARVGRILVDCMRHETVVRNGAALELFPIPPMGIREAIAAALRNEDHEFAQTRWSNSLSTANPKRDWGGVRFGNRIVDTRTVTVAATPEAAFAVIERERPTTRLNAQRLNAHLFPLLSRAQTGCKDADPFVRFLDQRLHPPRLQQRHPLDQPQPPPRLPQLLWRLLIIGH